MNRTILSIAYPFAQVGEASVGGAEQVLATLERAWVSRGFNSVVVACEGSRVCGELLATASPDAIITPEVREVVAKTHQSNIDRALSSYAVDLVHMHGIDFDRYRIPLGVPVLVTLHLPPSWYPDSIWHLPANYQLQCVSKTQRSACPARLTADLPVIGNGVALPSLEAPVHRKDYALMLSRICPEKNLHIGLDAARIAHIPVLLAGETFPYREHLRYLHEQIEPRLGAHSHLLGSVGGFDKTRLLKEARCVLLPTLAPETSSLVAMEALAAGTPVIGFASGAIPEIIEDQRTGFLVSSAEEMAAAIHRVHEIDRAVCREVAASRFSLQTMIERYIALYDKIIDQHIVRSRHGAAASGA